MARLSSIIVLLLIAAAGQAAPAPQALATLAAPFAIGPNGLPNLPTMLGPSGPLTMTELGGNVVACPSQVTFSLSSTTYLDCLEPVSTVTLGTSSAAALQLVPLTISAGLTLEGLPLVYANRTDTVTLLPFSTGQVSSASISTGQGSSASGATRTGGSASSFGSSSSPSTSTQPGGSASSFGLSSSPLASSQPGGNTPSSLPNSSASGQSSSTLQPGGTGPASLSIAPSASAASTQGTSAASAPSASHASSADSLSANGPTAQAPPSTTSASNGSPAPAPSTYSIDGVGFTGNPTSLVAGSTTLTPGGAPLITSSHTFSIPVSATGGQINVDGTLTTLPGPRTSSGPPARSSFSSQSNSTSQSIPGTVVGGITSTSGPTSSQGSRTSEAVVGSTTSGASVPGASTSAVSSFSQTPNVTSTETALPPGASAETLVSGAFLFNQWVTTTKPGSSTPTLIPIILPPGGGLPIALWGFIPGPPPGGNLPNPPALEINIPNLPDLKIPCVKLFGLKFGDCSSDDNNNDNNNSDNPTNNPTNTQPAHTEPSNAPSATSTAQPQSSSSSRPLSSSGSQSCSGVTATITQVSCATAGSSISCTTQFNTNVGCSASGSAITSGSCVASTTIGSSTACCSSATVSSGSTVCAFADLTQYDMNSPPGVLQTIPPSAQLASEWSAYLATHSGAGGGFGNASATGSVSSASHASSTGPVSVSATATAVSAHSSAPSAGFTTSSRPSSLAPPAPTNGASASSAALAADNPLCIANGLAHQCVCSTGTIIVTISSYFNPSSNVCGFTAIPSTPVVTPHTSSTPKPTGAIYSYTDPNYGYVVACDSTYTSEVAGYVITECTGSSSTISTVESIVSANSAYGLAESSSSAASAASAASVSAAAATPTARILITYYTYEDDDVFIYQYRAYDGVPNEEIAYCSTASPISFVNLNNGNGDPSDLPTNQLPKFTTHGIHGCSYSSPSSSEAGTVSCPGWSSPVQCTSVVGSDAQEYQCPTFSGGTEQQPIVDCDWGSNP